MDVMVEERAANEALAAKAQGFRPTTLARSNGTSSMVEFYEAMGLLPLGAMRRIDDALASYPAGKEAWEHLQATWHKVHGEFVTVRPRT